MKPYPFRIMLPLFFAVTCFSASAQEKIVASKPADSNVDTNSPIMGDNERRINAGDYNAPKHFFNDSSPTLSAPAPIYLGNVSRAALEEADKQRNWTLLTPEQILGVQTPESILGIKSKDADQNLSLEDQYLLRLHSAAEGGLAKGKAGSASQDNNNDTDPLNPRDLRPAMNPFDNMDRSGSSRGRNNNFGPPSSAIQTPNQDQMGQARTLSQLFNQANSASFDRQQSYSAWTSPFAQPIQTKPSQNQIDARNRFKTLLESSSALDNKTASQTRFSGTSQSDSTSASFFQQQPQYNPAGKSVDVLQDNSTRPVGLQPLPSISGPTLNQPTTQPSWKPQPPPWLRTGPQMH